MPQKSKSKKREPKGFQIRQGGTSAEDAAEATSTMPARSFEDLGDLPHGYGSDTIFLVAQEPHRLFTYWDIDISRHPGGAAFLRVFAADGALEAQIEVPFEVRNWYVPVSSAGCEYHVEIGYFRGRDWNLVARSVPVTTPPESLSPSDDFDFATVPFHLSYQRMVDRVEAAARSGEDLLAALSRMQRGGDFSAFGPAPIADLLASDPRTLLAGLLGPGFLDELASSGLSSAQIETAIRERMDELLSSGGASEILGSFAAAGFGSQFAESSFGSESFSSWAATELAGALSSWSGETSWSASLTAGGETSWFAAGSWLQAISGSWESGAVTSWTSGGAVSSWLQAGQSSWAQAALSSWGSAEFSSWFAAAAESSWLGASETLSSFGLERGFFMHVNAEVIFYGGTDPNARVTIDGVPVPLDSGGNFRHHFVFPDADYDIPIVAESPDGLETRSATLRFHRDTGKVGLVTDTPQPALGEPMGRIW